VVLVDEPQRPPLAPEPPSNQNDRQRRLADVEFADERPLALGRVIAWIVLAPFYAATLVGSVGLNVIFIRGLLRI
jgi:hypothetical protein